MIHSPASLLVASTAWTYVERVSWIVTVIGIPVATTLGLIELRGIR